MLLDTLGASLSGNLLMGKGTIRVGWVHLEQLKLQIEQAVIF